MSQLRADRRSLVLRSRMEAGHDAEGPERLRSMLWSGTITAVQVRPRWHT